MLSKLSAAYNIYLYLSILSLFSFLFSTMLGLFVEFLLYFEFQVLESDKANTVDIMKYILSYASNPSMSSEYNNLYSRELVESSARNLLRQMIDVSFGDSALTLPASEQCQLYAGNEHPPRPIRQNVEMKRGDWICPK